MGSGGGEHEEAGDATGSKQLLKTLLWVARRADNVSFDGCKWCNASRKHRLASREVKVPRQLGNWATGHREMAERDIKRAWHHCGAAAQRTRDAGEWEMQQHTCKMLQEPCCVSCKGSTKAKPKGQMPCFIITGTF